jgi:predicted O-methyltransferase YrrM
MMEQSEFQEQGEQMSQEKWTAVDRYITEKLVPADPALEAALEANAAAGLPSIDVAPNQGKLLHLLALTKGARRILEIGTLGGYSTIWLARALPAGGTLVTLELSPKHAAVARANLERAGVAELVEIRVGAALDSLAKLVGEGEGAEAFDMIFIDADKQNIPEYMGWAIQLAKPGSLIVTDNVIRDGAVIDPDSADTAVQGVQRMFEMLAAEPRLTATAIQTVGSKGYDGFAMAIVNGA